MSVVPCGPVAAEDFTDAQTDMTDAIDTFTDDGNSEESENTVNTDQITEEEFPGSDIGTETDEAESSESEEIQQDSDEGLILEEPSAVIRKAEGTEDTEEAAAPEEILVTEKTRSSRKIYSQMIFRQQVLPKRNRCGEHRNISVCDE